MRREQGEEPKGGDGCCWQSQGVRCMYRGIISAGTTGGGQWYCREHWARAQGQQPDCLGNELPRAKPVRNPNAARPVSPLRAMIEAGGPKRFAEVAGVAGVAPQVVPERDFDDVPF